MAKVESIQRDIGDGGDEKFRPQNRKKINPNDLKKLTPLQRSRYMAYEDPPKHVQEAQMQTKKRLLELRKQQSRNSTTRPLEEEAEWHKHIRLIGQLKAAEARNRLRIMRLRYQANKAQEIGHLIACQPVALKAVRLQALLPHCPEKKSRPDDLTKSERHRVESLVEDGAGLLTNRAF
ncbi:protein LKAAEAR1-like [Pomacea canaliculata]|uniref:protein LKAAEAR1-like n=1 Tax=Pomacea canaliculata TaxID=400727 RepID=UPI000D727D37|nr:protein LKAAEAR1-like [Pomacea canaliculata]